MKLKEPSGEVPSHPASSIIEDGRFPTDSSEELPPLKIRYQDQPFPSEVLTGNRLAVLKPPDHREVEGASRTPHRGRDQVHERGAIAWIPRSKKGARVREFQASKRAVFAKDTDSDVPQVSCLLAWQLEGGADVKQSCVRQGTNVSTNGNFTPVQLLAVHLPAT